MGKPKLTPWFPSCFKPARPGVYETSMGNHSAGYSYWTGTRWSNQRRHIEWVERGDLGGAYQGKQWRGLAEQPK